MLGAVKLKSDVTDLCKKAPNWVTAQDIVRLSDDVKGFRATIANTDFEVH